MIALRTILSISAAAMFLSATAASQTGSYVNFESPQTNPLRLSPDGTRLFAANTSDNRLSVFDISNPSNPVLMAEISVGLDPVSLCPRTNDEVWVVNQVSDSVSVVSVSQGIVLDTIPVKDEPFDIIFAGSPERAYVTVGTQNEIRVFDTSTHAQLASIPLLGKQPRALARSADGSKLYAAFALSGNRTTCVNKNLAPPQPPPTNPNLPPPPKVGLIVDATDPAWTAALGYGVLDHDVVEINTSNNSVARYFDRAGTVNFGLAVQPGTGDLFVTNTEARNLIHFETNLRGHFIDSRVTKVTTGATPVVTPIDLNPGVDYNILPNPAAKATFLSQPVGVVFENDGAHLWIAAFGSDKIARLDASGNVVSRIDIGPNAGATTDSRRMRGPRALAWNEAASRMYVFNRVSDTISVVDTQNNIQIQEVPAGSRDPVPAVVRSGRGFLFDAKLSGNGSASCAACHIDGWTDLIDWDLGNPGGTMVTVVDPELGNTFQMHPMKGPMLTQHLRSLRNIAPYHWRGDRTTLNDFNGAFDSLMGGSQLAAADMQAFSDYVNTLQFPPNPWQNLNRTLPTSVPGVPGNPQIGFNQYSTPPANCIICHKNPLNFTPHVAPDPLVPQGLVGKVPPGRDYYRKIQFNNAPGAQNIQGFGFNHDGTAPPFGGPNSIGAFLMCYDSGSAPAVGFTRTVTPSNANQAQLANDVTLLRGQAAAANIDLVGKGRIDGVLRGLLYNPATQLFSSDSVSGGTYSWTDLQTKAAAGAAVVSLMGVPPGSGVRLGIDRDLDGVLDGDQTSIYLSHYGSSTGTCGGTMHLDANSQPWLGNSVFGFTCTNVPALSLGIAIVGDAADVVGTALLGVTFHVSFASTEFYAFDFYGDSSGFGVCPTGIPNDPTLDGRTFFAQSIWLSACGPSGLAASDALSVLLFQP
jgi:YVTN family beta-propeller protein